MATRSSGQASAGYGRSDEMVEKLRVATPKGSFGLVVLPVLQQGRICGSSSSEAGILGIITEVTMRVRRQPRDKRYEGVMFPTYEDGLRAFREMVSRRATADLMRLSDSRGNPDEPDDGGLRG